MKKHFVLTSGRSGSNYLVNTLNRHPRIVNYGEILGEWTKSYRLYRFLAWTGMGWQQYIDHLYNSFLFYYFAQGISARSHLRRHEKIYFKPRNQVSSIGIKDFAFLIKKRNLIKYLTLSENIQVIHLHRKNILKKYLSLVRMNQTGIIGTTKSLAHKPVYITTDTLLESLNHLHHEQELEISISQNISKNRIFTIYYENYFESERSISDTNIKLFEFIGVQPLPVKSPMKKIGSNDLKQDILNYHEVCATLRGTENERFLYE